MLGFFIFSLYPSHHKAKTTHLIHYNAFSYYTYFYTELTIYSLLLKGFFSVVAFI